MQSLHFRYANGDLAMRYTRCGLDLVVSYVLGIICQFRLGPSRLGPASSVAPRPANASAAALTHFGSAGRLVVAPYAIGKRPDPGSDGSANFDDANYAIGIV